MKRRIPLRQFVWACALGVGLTVLGGCGSEPTSATGPPGARLIVFPELTQEAMFGLVSGTLGINDQGCFTIDDHVLVVGKGSRVLSGGKSIDVADVGVVEVGARASGAGGIIEGSEQVDQFAGTVGIKDQVMTCQADVADPSFVVLDPSGP